MQAGFPVGIVVLGSVLVLDCGGTVHGVAAPDEGLPLLVPPQVTPAVSARSGDEPVPTPPGPGETTGPCPLQWTPREMRAGVFTLPAELHGRMMAPLLRGLCACTRPGQSIAVLAHLVPERGEVTAQTADRTDQHARASLSIDACLARELGAARFEPFRVGSDVVLDCPPALPAARTPGQPTHLPAPRLVGCDPKAERFTTILYPLLVDRRDER